MASLGSSNASSPSYKVAIIGSGNWGSCVAKIIGENVEANPSLFDQQVRMWVYQEQFEGRNLTDLINERHENVKYLPGIKLPNAIYAEPNLVQTVQGANLLVFVTPHQFVKRTCAQLMGNIRADARAISLIKGMDVTEEGFHLISKLISDELNIPCSVLMGANIANDIAREDFAEATIGCKEGAEVAGVYKKLFQRPYFSVRTVEDVAAVEMCGTLKNIVAIAAGLVSGLGHGYNSIAAIIRIGFKEMIQLTKWVDPEVAMDTFFESCGVADLIATCMGGRNQKIAKLYAEHKGTKSFESLEAEHLGGQKLQGTLTAAEVYSILKRNNMTEQYPLFSSVYQIAYQGLPVDKIFELEQEAGN